MSRSSARPAGGKSYVARGLVEELLELGRRVCIVDYTGVWWGLRSAADGHSAGYPAVIFGGEHADVPINDSAGAIIGKFVAEGSAPTIIDLDGLTVGAQQRFMTAFCEELYRRNSRPLHLVIEEADEFAPMTGAPGAERMVGAVCRIFQRGRRKGFRAIAITQRPANLHTRVRAQCKTLVVLALFIPQDRKAFADWIKGNTTEEAVDDLLAALHRSSLAKGLSSPRGSASSNGARSRRDSMHAPEEDEPAGPDNWPAVDLNAVRAEMGEIVREAEENDPVRRKAEIARLKSEIQKRSVPTTVNIDLSGERAAEQRGYASAMAAIKPRIVDLDRAIALSRINRKRYR
jgi:hypothetical protein